MPIVYRSWHVPDETWQSVEVSHLLAFGSGHLTWEWRDGLRSHLHPLFFVPAQLLGHLLGSGDQHLERYLVVLMPR